MISPTISVIINLGVCVLGVIAGSAGYFTDMFGQVASKDIVETAGFAVAIVGAINGGLHAYSSSVPGPAVKT